MKLLALMAALTALTTVKADHNAGFVEDAVDQMGGAVLASTSTSTCTDMTYDKDKPGYPNPVGKANGTSWESTHWWFDVPNKFLATIPGYIFDLKWNCTTYAEAYCPKGVPFRYGYLENYPELNCCGCGKAAYE